MTVDLVRSGIHEVAELPGMVGRHPSMRSLYRLARRIAATDLPVLISGESGTGKELVARAIHELSAHASGPFTDINCAAFPENLLDGELFGWVRGSFSGADRTVAGLIENADGGTLFLDEACSLSAGAQAKLLRAIERREIRMIGGRNLIGVNFRLILATSRSLADLVATQQFRADFAYRVDGIQLTVPPLRERASDIRLLAEHFLARVNRAARRERRWSSAALQMLRAYGWPGNVRELEGLVKRLGAITHSEELGIADLALAGFVSTGGNGARATARRLGDAGRSAASVLTEESIREAIERANGVVSRAARDLGISRQKLYRAMERLGIELHTVRSGSRATTPLSTSQHSP